jgi:hypothetical protein
MSARTTYRPKRRDRRDRKMAETGEFYCKNCRKIKPVAGGCFMTDSQGARHWRCAPCRAVHQPPTPLPVITHDTPLRRVVPSARGSQ